ncbi:MAG: hypothetical protein WC806_01920 [Candidatus Gracilibacteria bacterium]|jgi:hypothetical protein
MENRLLKEGYNAPFFIKIEELRLEWENLSDLERFVALKDLQT